MKYDHGIVAPRPNTNRCWNCSRAFCVMIDLKVMIIMIIDHDNDDENDHDNHDDDNDHD